MKRKILVLTFAMAIVVGANAQSTSTYTPITQNDSDVAAVTNENNLKLNDEYLKWQSKYEEVGTEINDVAAQIDQETAKRGYPKKKTVSRRLPSWSSISNCWSTNATIRRYSQWISTREK